MVLFIAGSNTSYVTLYLNFLGTHLIGIPISKHLMLLFIGLYWSWLLRQSISKHLMLLFIKVVNPSCHLYCNFKTSHVTLYRPTGITGIKIYVISKHLMLLFIVPTNVWHRNMNTISKHLMLLFICAVADSESTSTLFQNISCYSLSG